MEVEKNAAPVDTAAEPSSGEPVELNHVDDIAAAFDTEEQDAAQEPDAAAVEEPAKADEQPDADGEQPAEGTETPADVPMPDGMEAEMWGKLDPTVRSAIHAREQAHAAAISQERQNYAALRTDREQFAVAANAQIQQSLATMKQIVDGEYSGIDWNALAAQDPAQYVQLQQSYQQRMAAIQAIQQNVAKQTQVYEQHRAQEGQRLMQSEFETVAPEIKAMVGADWDGKKFASDVAGYMREQGCPDTVINGLTKGYELKLITKAMLFDRQQKARATAAQKVAEAPKVQAPRGTATADAGNARLERARALLNKNPNSTDALASVFESL